MFSEWEPEQREMKSSARQHSASSTPYWISERNSRGPGLRGGRNPTTTADRSTRNNAGHRISPRTPVAQLTRALQNWELQVRILPGEQDAHGVHRKEERGAYATLQSWALASWPDVVEEDEDHIEVREQDGDLMTVCAMGKS